MKADLGLVKYKAYLAQVVSVGGSALLTLASAWILSPDDRGRLATCVLIMTLGSYVLSLGVQSEILQLASRGQGGDALRIIALFCPVILLFSGISYFVLAGTNIFGTIGHGLLLAAMAAAGLGAVFNLFSWMDYGGGNFVRSTLLRGVIPATAFLGITVGLVAGGNRVLLAVSAYSVASLVSVCILASKLLPSTGVPSCRLDRLSLARNSLAFFATQAGTMFWLRLPVLIVSIRGTAVQTAVVGLGVALAELQNYLPQIRAAMTFREAAQDESPRLGKRQVLQTVLAILPGAIAALMGAFILSLSLADSYRILPLVAACAVPGVAGIALLASTLNVLAVQRRSASASSVLLAVLALTGVAAWQVFPSSVILGTSLWSAAALAMSMAMTVAAMRARDGLEVST